MKKALKRVAVALAAVSLLSAPFAKTYETQAEEFVLHESFLETIISIN